MSACRERVIGYATSSGMASTRHTAGSTPVINVMNVPFVNAHRTNVCGTTVNALGVDHLENTWLGKAG